MLKKFIIKHKGILLAFIVGICVTTYFTDNTPLTDHREQIITTIFNNPTLFPLDEITEAAAKDYWRDYNTMSNSVWETEYPDEPSLAAAKEKAINKTMGLITRATRMAADVSSGGSQGIFIGDTDNYVAVSVVGKNTLTTEELAIYRQNIRTILEAIPSNIPVRNVLTEFTLDKIRYFETFAKVKFVEDTKAAIMDNNQEKYRGQF